MLALVLFTRLRTKPMFSFLLRVRLICAVDRSFLGGKNIKNIKNGGVAKKHVEHFSRRTFFKFFF